jgi:ABC-2 type transport system ATP-binding protein
LIEVKKLTKKYSSHVAVNNINFSIKAGEIVGFLGPNGAGKTTTMNILTGFIAATTGDVLINEIDIQDQPEKAKSHIGYLPDTPPVYGDMRVDEYLFFVAEMKKVPRAERKKMLDAIKAEVQIADVSRRLIKNLSRGYRQRVGLAQAMVGNPRVIIMDEPTIGLDPKQIIEMRNVVKKLGNKHTVMLSSHIMQEVSAVCDRVIIINHGEIIAQGTAQSLSSHLTKAKGMNQVIVKADENALRRALAAFPIITHIEINQGREAGTLEAELAGSGGVDIREAIFNALANAKLPILSMRSMDMTLEEVFLKLTTEGRTITHGSHL